MKDGDFNIMERSLQSSRLVFQKTLEEMGAITQLQAYVLDKVYEALPLPKRNGIIFLKVRSITHKFVNIIFFMLGITRISI